MKALGILLLALIGAGVALFYGMRDYVMTTGFCTICKTMYTLTAPPADYYAELARNVELTAKGDAFEAKLTVVTKYHGGHVIEVYSADARNHYSKLPYRARCFVNSQEVAYADGSTRQKIVRDGMWGYSLLYFRTPGVASVGETIHCEVTLQRIGPATPVISVSKWSDV
jgi:hypothetical protein